MKTNTKKAYEDSTCTASQFITIKKLSEKGTLRILI